MTTTVTESAAERLRAIHERESEARLALKRARAERFLELVRKGERVTVAWQAIAIDRSLCELEDRYEAARIALVVENAINWGKLPADDDREDAPPS